MTAFHTALIPEHIQPKVHYFTRGTSRDEYAAYTEDSEAYKRNMDRLLKKWDTAKGMVHAPQVYQEKNTHPTCVIFYGTSTYAAEEALDILKEHKLPVDALRLRSFPFNTTVEQFIQEHETVYVIEQNRDGQMKSLLMMELQVNPAKLVSVLNYDGTPITAEIILRQISPTFKSDRNIQKNIVI
jgi:2-oxoglutarate ferredoxin oxidoreductase subunit alpha